MTPCDLDLLSLYLDDSLTLPARVNLEGHIRNCGPCASELETLRGVDYLLASWGSVRNPIPAGTHARVVRSVGRKRRLGPVAALSRVMPAAVGTLIAALLVLVSVNLGSLYQNQAGVTVPVQTVNPRAIVERSSRLIQDRRTSAMLGSYKVRYTRTLPLRRLHLGVN